MESEVAITADELLSAPGESRADEAQQWLEQFLAAGPQPSAKVFEAGARARHAKKTLYRASDLLHIDKRKDGAGPWTWALPVETAKVIEALRVAV